eukprot:TRINITY_DN9375_c0_g1_i2.p1 TRINITY_DN9375_c0_g1~~TRINITY_DN9375_c0_g1_i2.p1  ORF type:complete len:519 (+),score=169.08 TRINITY_DN9375_c0_g1_i2:398-1954(+)
MVVLSAAVVTKGGKSLVSRQFVEIPRIRVEGLLSAFPKLLDKKNQHTYVETENVRYVYQPMESLYLLLVTNKASNILEDLETLRLLAKVLSEYCRHFNETEVLENAFELVFAFDEVIALGYRENVSLHQIRTYLEMESVEEQRQEELKKEQMKIAQQMANKKAKELDLKRAQQTAKAAIQGFGSNTTGPGGMGGGSMGGNMGGGMGGSGFDSGPSAEPRVQAREERPAPSATAKKGMKLGKAQKQQDILQALIDEGDIDAAATSTSSAVAPSQAAVPTVEKKPVNMTIVETVSAQFNRNSGMESLEIKGDLTMVVNDQNATHVKAKLSCGPNKGFQLRTHPNINKQLFAESNVLALKDPSRAFPIGADLAVLKWRATSTNEDDAPLVISVWPSPAGGGKLLVNADYALKPGVVLHDVKIRMGVPGIPNVTQIDGTYKVNAKATAMMWEIDMIDSNNDTGSIEFTVDGSDSDVFFPVAVAFTSPKPLVQVAVEAVATLEGKRVPFGETAVLTAEEYVIA